MKTSFTKYIDFEVSAEDIDQGLRGSVDCAVARAITRCFGNVTVFIGTINRRVCIFCQDKLIAAYHLTDELWDYVMNIDDGAEVKSTSFTLKRIA